MRLWAILAVSCAFVTTARAQTPSPTDTLAEARRLRDANRFAAAADLLRAYVDSHPDDAGSARFAALMAYWSKRTAVADSLYARALADHEDDVNLRLEYGRFLMETGAHARAHEVLAPIVSADSATFQPPEIARARTLLGTADYWRGDYTAARREFITALSLDSSVTDARRQLMEIESASASWVRFSADVWDDDQPLTYVTFDADGGWFLNPLTPLGVHARSTLFDAEATSLLEFLISREGMPFVGAMTDVLLGGGTFEQSLRGAQRVPTTIDDLDRAWRSWLETQRREAR